MLKMKGKADAPWVLAAEMAEVATAAEAHLTARLMAQKSLLRHATVRVLPPAVISPIVWAAEPAVVQAMTLSGTANVDFDNGAVWREGTAVLAVITRNGNQLQLLRQLEVNRLPVCQFGTGKRHRTIS